MSRHDMPKILLAPTLRYGSALLSVALATLVRLALDPILGVRYPFITFYVAIVFIAWHCGLGPSLVAVSLSWLAIDHLLLQPHSTVPIFAEKSQIVLPFFAIGLTIALLGESVRAARRRAEASAFEA